MALHKILVKKITSRNTDKIAGVSIITARNAKGGCKGELLIYDRATLTLFQGVTPTYTGKDAFKKAQNSARTIWLNLQSGMLIKDFEIAYYNFGE